MARRSRPPSDRVRARLEAVAGPEIARTMPAGYQRLGRVLLLRLPATLRPWRRLLGTAWQEELGVETVLARAGPVTGELREPFVELLAGERTETEVREHGISWRFDARRIMFAGGNRTERARAGRLSGPKETVADLFAGIGYFAIPAARAGASVWAVEKNPVAFGYLIENARRNRVAERVRGVPGDNRLVDLPLATFDRVFLGYLPTALPWLGRAAELVRPEGGWIHLHSVEDARGATASAELAVRAEAVRTGVELVGAPRAREVKPYGPGRTHVVVDVRAVGPS